MNKNNFYVLDFNITGSFDFKQHLNQIVFKMDGKKRILEQKNMHKLFFDDSFLPRYYAVISCNFLTPDEHSFYFNLKGNLCSFYKGKILKIDELNTTKIPDRKTYKNISRYLKTLVIINTI